MAMSASLLAVNKIPLPFEQRIKKSFELQCGSLSQEKLYLQTDKPYYNAGETLWFKAYLLNASTHEGSDKSNFIYVELIDKADSVHSRVKIRRDSLGFNGYIALKPNLPAGNYQLRAYSYWMRNVSSDFFFKKNLYIGNSINTSTQSSISYGVEKDGFVPVTVSLFNENKQPKVGADLQIKQFSAKGLHQSFIAKTNPDGHVTFQLPTAAVGEHVNRIQLEFAGKDTQYTTSFFVPAFDKDIDLQFFPESAVFLSDQVQTVAFKAIGTNGLSVEVHGKVYSSKGIEITQFTSLHKGMGTFAFTPEKGESYYAIVTSHSGIEKKFNLPATHTKGISLHCTRNKGKIFYEVINQTDKLNSSLSLLLHSRGQLIALKPLINSEGQVSEASLPPGIVSFSVVDTLGTVYCERLCFAKSQTPPAIIMTANKEIYACRDSVKLEIKLQTPDGMPLDANMSLSVTDNETVDQASVNDHILSHLLLTSDLKGYIEDPAFYFNDNTTLTNQKLDLLLLTQGWRRFNTVDVLNDRQVEPKYYVEAGQAISGRVLNIFNKPSANCGIFLISANKNIFKSTLTNDQGLFIADGIDFADSTQWVVKAKKAKSISDVDLLIDADDFPSSKVFIPMTNATQTIAGLDNYLKQSRERYYTEGGVRVYNLDAVTVKGERIEKQENKSYATGLADVELNAEKLSKSANLGIMTILSTMPGIAVSAGEIRIRGAKAQPTIFLDDVEIESINEIQFLTGNDLEQIQVFKGAGSSIYGLRGGNGVISIYLKKGVENLRSTPPSIAHISPLGYQKPAEFYVPKYQVDSIRLSAKPDLRTTIYWNPHLVTNKNGLVQVAFFTADKPVNYTLVLEGISVRGEIVRFVDQISTKK